MPYKIEKRGSEHCVFNKETGENKGCSDSYPMAVAHMRALYMADEGKPFTRRKKKPPKG